MSLGSSRHSVPPGAWMDVLEQIQCGLEKVIAVTAEREQSLEPGSPTVATDPAAEAVWQSLLERQQAIQAGLEEFIQRAERNVTTAEAVLNAATEAAQHWLGAAARLRQRLAKRPGSEV